VTSAVDSRTASVWWTRRARIAHIVIALWVPGCALATWWQVNIALSGDSLGWVYSVMWPCFALFSVVLWWNVVHDDPDTVGARGLRRLREETARDAGPSEPPSDDVIARAEAEDAELAAYNAYLAQLQNGPESKTWRRR
jgi:hypothetical protein